ncbi:LysR family transcriptional regulator [Aliigemmobacter aestuarii]|uniref:LysR family transcriptional regulator n=1 Tax=Aliigemmobacter aestuarii TaxID=1445661 RepID=A0A4S3MLQ4_9RHOB|nr:LysR family transcriptional regulator [Gemmobacter aestuarii]THD82429.1 LysR family transcriptional regulator [Gemmobacter aestuarii]
MSRKSLLVRDPRILRSLQYFEAVARLGSVAAAGEELGVSASAVSHQLRSLSGFVGEVLFHKSGRGLVLSEKGILLQSMIATAFSQLDTALSGTIFQEKKCLRIAVCSSFGPFWLAERLPKFLARNPGLNIELRLYAQDPELSDQVADVIVTANTVREGFDSVTLFEETLIAVGKPGTAPIEDDLPESLITTDVPPDTLGKDWHDFCAGAGLDATGIEDTEFVRCTHYLLALALAKAGVGVALVPEFVANEAIEAGQVVCLNPVRVPSGRRYRFCYKAARRSDPDLRTLIQWMKSLVNSSTRSDQIVSLKPRQQSAAS